MIYLVSNQKSLFETDLYKELDVKSALEMLNKEEILAADTETEGFDWLTKKILTIQLGNADGQNWWCVLYPSLCFVDITSGIVPQESKEQLQEDLNDEEYKIISNTDTPINIKFKLIEFFTQNNIITAKSSN